MNSWSRNRKRIILSILIFVLIVLIGIPTYLLFYKAPTCFDGKMNGDERGVDCGGSCQRLCTPDSLPLILKGDPRVLSVASTTYEVVALLSNPNANASISRARYTFKLFSSDSLVPVKAITGEVYVPKGAEVALFEGPFVLEEGVVPVRATLEWEPGTLIWEKDGQDTPALNLIASEFTRLESSPRLTALITNPNLFSVSNVDLVALLYDETGSIFAAGRTFIEALAPGEETPALFTWPRPLPGDVVEVEVVIRVLPDRRFLR